MTSLHPHDFSDLKDKLCQLHLTTKVDIPESKIPVKSLSKRHPDNERLIETLRTMADNLTLALNTPSKRLSSQFRTPLTLKI